MIHLDEFVNFSSAKKRIENFVEKVRQIQVYENDINYIRNYYRFNISII
jgi:hypothetical protein